MPVNREELEHYRLMFENELFSILSYWINYSLEEDERSFYGAVDINNLPVINADKSCVLNARILWTFSAAAIKYQKDEYSKIADIAYNVVANELHLQ